LVAGLEDITAGTVEINGNVVNHLSPRERDVAMVFQNYALYPHYTVAENLGFSLKIRHYPKPDARDRVRDTARVLGLDALLDRKPAALSGGQRQRVAMGRSLVRQPSLLLMDEPLSNLDAKLRVAMRGELIRLHQRYKTTTLYVDPRPGRGDDAGGPDRGARPRPAATGGHPDELYRTPCNVFVAGFIGSPAMNLARGTLSAVDGTLELHAADFVGALPADWAHRWPDLVDRAGQEVIFGLRPDAFREGTGTATFDAVAVTVESLGDEKNVLFVPPFDQGGVDASRSEDEVAPLWTARFDPDVTVRPGDQLVLRPTCPSCTSSTRSRRPRCRRRAWWLIRWPFDE
jgi:multiple sugar transport system ATP-binding protein